MNGPVAARVTPLRDSDPELIRTPPYNREVEQWLLGAILCTDGRAYSRVSGFLRPEHFGSKVHARIYAAIGTLVERGQIANPVLLKDLFAQDEALAEIGGARYLVELAHAGATVTTNTEDYGHRIRDLHYRRELIGVAKELEDSAYEVVVDYNAAAAIAARIGARLDEISLGAPDRPKLFDPTSLTGRPVPDREWIVAPWIPIRRATGLYGAPGAGKTSIIQMLCTAGAIKQPWLGLPVRPCRSVLLYCEDDEDEMHFRQEAINRFFGCCYDDLGDMRWLPRLGEDNALMVFEQGRGIKTPLFHQVLADTKRFNARLLVVDALSDVFAGNEIDRRQARQFVQEGFAYMAREINGAVVACAHPSVAGVNTGTGISGSTGWPGAFRSHLYLHSPKSDPGDAAEVDLANPERVLTRKKMNWATAGETIKMRWCDGVFVADAPQPGILGAIGRRTCERVFLDLLDAATAENQPISSNINAPRNYAPRFFAKKPEGEREKFKASDFEQAMRRLLKDRRIINEPYGRKGDERWRIIRAPEKA
jgi:RecA-family ATPase